MTGVTLANATLDAEPFHDPKGAASAPWCVTEWNGRMSIRHRFATKEEAEAFIDDASAER
jgi:hypothetical protein